LRGLLKMTRACSFSFSTRSAELQNGHAASVISLVYLTSFVIRMLRGAFGQGETQQESRAGRYRRRQKACPYPFYYGVVLYAHDLFYVPIRQFAFGIGAGGTQAL